MSLMLGRWMFQSVSVLLDVPVRGREGEALWAQSPVNPVRADLCESVRDRCVRECDQAAHASQN